MRLVIMKMLIWKGVETASQCEGLEEVDVFQAAA